MKQPEAARRRERVKRQKRPIKAASRVVRQLMMELDKTDWSYRDLANEAGISGALLAKWRAGQHTAQVLNVEVVGEVLGLELVWARQGDKEVFGLMTIWGQRAQKLSNEQIAILHRAEAERQRHQSQALEREPIREAMQELADESDRAHGEIEEVCERIEALKKQLANEQSLLAELEAVQVVRAEAISKLQAIEPMGQLGQALIDELLALSTTDKEEGLQNGPEVQS